VGFDLFAWPIDGPVSQQEAAAELERLLEEDTRDDAADPRLRAFVADLRARFPAGFPHDDEIGQDWQPPHGAVVFELDVSREHVFLGIPWPFVSQVGEAAQEVASRHDVLLFDPQTATAILPPRFGGKPVALSQHSDEVEAFTAEIADHVDVDISDLDLADGRDAMRAFVRAAQAAGARIENPLGFEVTEALVGEMFDDPTGLPTMLQTSQTKARLISNLRSPKKRPRLEAVTQLAGWDADEEVDSALREALRSDDDFVRWMAASGLARHRYVASFEDLLEVMRRASPAGGGDVGAMVLPTRSALELAGAIGPEAIERVRRLVVDWRGALPAKPRQADRELDRVLRGE
jgi:hypothetical protein